MMLFALLVLASPADWVPARWFSNDVKSLELVAGTPVNCLLLGEEHWSAEFNGKAGAQGIATLGVLRPNGKLEEAATRARTAGLTGVVLEGIFEQGALTPLRRSILDSRLKLVELGPRTAISFDSEAPILGTFQGIWPGINQAEDGSVKAAPSGAPWIDTNSGFLRFARASTNAELWIGYEPPKKSVIPLPRYMQAIGDAAIIGARWVVSLDADFTAKLLARRPSAVGQWEAITGLLGYFEQNRDWRRLPGAGQLAIVQDASSGGLISGGILDMIAVKHTPVRAVPSGRLSGGTLRGARMAVNVNPDALTPEQAEALKAFTRGGGTLLTAPPGWKFPPQRPEQITLGKEDVQKLDTIWKEVNSMTGRQNLGVRLFNVASVLSNLQEMPGGGGLLLQLLNCSDYPIEAVTAHFHGKFAKAELRQPGAPPRALHVYEIAEGTGVEIDSVKSVASLIVQ